MSITINGSTGISGVDGSASTPSYRGADSNTGISFGTDTLSLVTGGSERLYIDSSGKIGINSTAPQVALQLGNYSGNNQLAITSGSSTGTGAVFFGDGTGADLYRGYIQYYHVNDSLEIGTAAQGRVTVDSSGRLLVNTATASSSQIFAVQGRTSDAASYANIGLRRGSAPTAGNPTLAVINFCDNNENQAAYVLGGFDPGTWTSGSSHPGYLALATTADGASSPTERMRISSNGLITVKGPSTASPFVRLSGILGGDANYSLDIRQPATNSIDIYQRWFTSGQNEQLVLRFGSGNLFSLVTYSTVVGGTNRDLYIDNVGLIGYVSSTRNSKDNIAEITDTAWLNQLNPVSFNRRRLNEDKQYTDELYSELEYGLIAEEVEQIAPELCFYDDVDGEQELRGVHYSKLITPMLKALQQANTRIETLEAEVTALKGA